MYSTDCQSAPIDSPRSSSSAVLWDDNCSGRLRTLHASILLVNGTRKTSLTTRVSGRITILESYFKEPLVKSLRYSILHSDMSRRFWAGGWSMGSCAHTALRSIYSTSMAARITCPSQVVTTLFPWKPGLVPARFNFVWPRYTPSLSRWRLRAPNKGRPSVFPRNRHENKRPRGATPGAAPFSGGVAAGDSWAA